MEMQHFWLLDQMARKYIKFYYQLGQENPAGYPTKYQTSSIHQDVRPYYVYMNNSPVELLPAFPPNLRRECAEILGYPYLQQVPLPRIPDYQKPSLGSEQLARTPDYCVANTAMLKPSQPVFLNGMTPFSTARHQQRIRVLQSLTNITTQ